MSPVVQVGSGSGRNGEPGRPRALVRRLLLTPAQFGTVLAEAADREMPVQLPAELPAQDVTGEPTDPEARAGLERAGVLGAGTEAAFAAVVTAVALAAAAPVRLVVRAGTAHRRRVTCFGLAADVLAALARDEQPADEPRPFEQSVANAGALGEQLLRCVPPLPVPAGPPRAAVRGADPALVAAAVAVADDADHDAVLETIVDLAGWSQPERSAALSLAGPLAASVEVTVTGTGAGDGPSVDRLVWVLGRDGWWQLAPGTDRSGQRVLDLLPVAAHDLPTAVAPLLAGALTTAGEAAAGVTT